MKNKKVTLRKCVGCQQMKNKNELLRIVKTVENNFVIDYTGKANGRGAYICNNITCFENSKKTRGFERSFKSTMSKEIYDKLESACFSNES